MTWLEAMAKIGCGKTPTQVRMTVKQILDLAGRSEFDGSNYPGKKWFQLFKKRHPNLKLARPGKLEICRAMCSKQKLETFFNQLEEICQRRGIKSASQIFNCDESGFSLQHKSNGNVLVSREMRHAYKLTNSSKDQITCLACICKYHLMSSHL